MVTTNKLSKYLLLTLFVFTFLTSNINSVQARTAVGLCAQSISPDEGVTGGAATGVDIAKIVCPAFYFFNIVVLASGVFFSLTLMSAARKYVLAEGDPKAIQAARDTATWAVFGFVGFVVIGTIPSIVSGLTGTTYFNSIYAPFDKLIQSIDLISNL